MSAVISNMSGKSSTIKDTSNVSIVCVNAFDTFINMFGMSAALVNISDTSITLENASNTSINLGNTSNTLIILKDTSYTFFTINNTSYISIIKGSQPRIPRNLG